MYTHGWVAVLTGHAEGLFSAWKGFAELRELGLAEQLPKMIRVEAQNTAAVAQALERGLDYVPRLPPEGTTIAYSIDKKGSSYQALRAVKDSNSLAVEVTDQEIIDAQLKLVSLEGIYAEPSSATAVAAVARLRKEGKIDSDDKVVCVISSTGLKHPEITMKALPTLPSVKPDWAAFQNFMKEVYGGIM